MSTERQNGEKEDFCIVMAAALLFAVVGAGVVISVRNSPEYALSTIVQDVQASGLEGLKPHLTGEALEAADKIDALSDNVILDAVSAVLDIDGCIDMLKSELVQVEWSLDDVQKDSGQAQVSLGFNYEKS